MKKFKNRRKCKEKIKMEESFLWFIAILFLSISIFNLNERINNLEKEIENIKIELIKEND